MLNWLLENVQFIAALVAVVLAALYAVANKKALEYLLGLWGYIVSLAVDILASIPAEEFYAWAQMIHDALPAWAQLFVSVDAIANALMKARDALLAEIGEQEQRLLSGDVLDALRSQVALFIG